MDFNEIHCLHRPCDACFMPIYITNFSIFCGLCLQESSILLGLRYIVASLSIYDEYSNDVLDMPEGSCFPRFTKALK